MSDCVQPHRQQPTRLPYPWDSPGKNTGVGCHFLLQCMKVKSESEVAQLCPTLRDLMDCSLPGSSIHGIFQARVLEWGSKEQVSFNFMAAITICSDFRAQKNKVSHCFPIYLPWSDGTNSIKTFQMVHIKKKKNLKINTYINKIQ